MKEFTRKRNIRKKLLCFFLFTFVVNLSGCEQKNFELHFHRELVLDYKSENSTCSLIEKIGSNRIEPSMIHNNKIKIDNFVVSCQKIDTNHLGSFTVLYQTNEANNREYLKQVSVKDISPPQIRLKNKSITLYEDEVSEFDIFKNVKLSVNDNSGEDPITQFKDIEKLKPVKGTYHITIVAMDKNKNKSKKTFSIIVKKREKTEELKKEETKQEILPNKNESNNGVITAPPIIQTPDPVIPVPKPLNKDYLFADGFDMNTASSTCLYDLNSSNYGGSCMPIKDTNGIYLGVKLTIY